jgi:hypothetical protein
MDLPSLTITLESWWVVAYLAVGCVVWFPASLYAETKVHRDPWGPHTAWAGFKSECRKHRWSLLWRIPVLIALWPLLLWDIR